jgi:cytochrome b561
VQPSDAVASQNPSLDAVPKEPLIRWVASNIVRLTLYLALASLSIAGYAVLAENAGLATLLGLSVIYFLYGAAFGIPGTIGWLLAVAFFPPE